jgi:acyl-CoA thioesterase FadM
MTNVRYNKNQLKNEAGILLVTGEVKVACVGVDGKIKRIPKHVSESLE